MMTEKSKEAKKCKQTNCNNEAVKVENHWSGDEYCRECVTKIDQLHDVVRDEKRLNMQQYGNEYGLIDTDEYWGREVSI